MGFRVAVVILVLVPALILANINQEVDVSHVHVGNVRFAFGGVQMLSDILKAVCKQKCPTMQRFFLPDTTRIFCALNCPVDPNGDGKPDKVKPDPDKMKDDKKPDPEKMKDDKKKNEDDKDKKKNEDDKDKKKNDGENPPKPVGY